MPQATPPAAPDAQRAAVAAALDEEERREFLAWARPLNLTGTSDPDEILAADVAGVLGVLDEDLDAFEDLAPRLDLFFLRVLRRAVRLPVLRVVPRAACRSRRETVLMTELAVVPGGDEG